MVNRPSKAPAMSPARAVPQTHAAAHHRLLVALGLGLLYMCIAVAGGILSGSLSLLADAGHFLMHNGALFIALMASLIARRAPDERFSAGYGRVESLGGYTNALLLLGVGFWVGFEALERFYGEAHHEVDTALMGGVAVAGVVLHLLAARVLHGGRRQSLNVYAAYLHILFDILATLTALAMAGLIHLTGLLWLDAVGGLLIACMIAASALRLLRVSGAQLMDAVPVGVSVKAVRAALLGIAHVRDVHDVIVRRNNRGEIELSAHIVLGESCVDGHHWHVCRQKAETLLRETFSIERSVLQMELREHVHPK